MKGATRKGAIRRRIVVFLLVFVFITSPLVSTSYGIFGGGGFSISWTVLINFLKGQFINKLKDKLVDRYQDWLIEVKKNPGILISDANNIRDMFEGFVEDGFSIRDLIDQSITTEAYEIFTQTTNGMWDRPEFRTLRCLSREVTGRDPKAILDQMLGHRVNDNIRVLTGAGRNDDINRILRCFMMDYNAGARTVSQTIDSPSERDRYRRVPRRELEEKLKYTSVVLSAGKNMVDPYGFNKALQQAQHEGALFQVGGRQTSSEFYRLITLSQKLDYATATAVLANSVALSEDAERRRLSEQIQQMAEAVVRADGRSDYTSDAAIKDMLKAILVQTKVQLMILDQLQMLNRLMAAKVGYDIDYEARRKLQEEINKRYAIRALGKESPGNPFVPETEYERRLEMKKLEEGGSAPAQR